MWSFGRKLVHSREIFMIIRINRLEPTEISADLRLRKINGKSLLKIYRLNEFNQQTHILFTIFVKSIYIISSIHEKGKKK